MKTSIIMESKGQSFSSSFILFMMLVCMFLMSGSGTCFATTVGLRWDAVANPEIIVGYKVYYQADPFTGPWIFHSSVENTLTNATISGLDPNYSYHLAVTAYDATSESSFSNVVYVPKLSPPIISIISPANNTSVSGDVPVTISASAEVKKVVFYLNDGLQPLYTVNGAPYSFTWNTTPLSNGNNILTAKAYDISGSLLQTLDISVSVNNVNDTVAPTVSISARVGATTESGTLSVTATAYDVVGISRIEYFVDGVLVTDSQTTTAPFGFTWDLRGKSHKSYYLMAKAYDAAGNVGQSPVVMVTVPNCSIR